MIHKVSQSGNASLKAYFDEFGDLKMRREINVSQDYIDECRRLYEESKGQTINEGTRLFALPTELYHQWAAEGFDFTTATPQDIKARLLFEGLDYLQVNANI